MGRLDVKGKAPLLNSIGARTSISGRLPMKILEYSVGSMVLLTMDLNKNVVRCLGVKVADIMRLYVVSL